MLLVFLLKNAKSNKSSEKKNINIDVNINNSWIKINFEIKTKIIVFFIKSYLVSKNQRLVYIEKKWEK